jgi:TolA-binding protein/predicted Ser/Thr protein kinase
MGDAPTSSGPADPGLPRRLGHYDVGEKIGQGGMAIVCKGVQPSLNRAVAIKILPPQFATTPELLGRFEREAAIVANLNHSNIVQLIDRGREDNILFIVMEFVEGQSLDKVIAAGPMPLPKAIDFGSQICEALAYAHAAGVVHRDLKPSNILIDERTGRVKIADFGIAALESTDAGLATLTADRSMIGTMNYMSPEQRRDAHRVTHRTDLFSLGVILYEMLTGKLPVGHFKLPSVIRPDLPLGLDAIVKRCLAESPEDRYADAGQIRDELQRLTIRHTAPRSFSVLGRLNKRQQWLALGGAAGVALVLLIGIAAIVGHVRGRARLAAAAAAAGRAGEGTPADAEGQADYVRAEALISQARWAEAVTALQEFVRQHPDHKLAAEAQLHIAKACGQLRERERSILEYERLIRNYPASPRVPEAIVDKCRAEWEKGRKSRMFGGPVWDAKLQERLIAELQELLGKHASGAPVVRALELVAEIAERPMLADEKTAAEALMKLYTLDPPNRADALFHAAELYDDDKGDRILAAAGYARFAQEFPSDPRAAQAQGRLKDLRPKEAP